MLCGEKTVQFEHNYHALISLLLPEGILEYFDIVNLSNDKSGLSIYPDEKNLPPVGYTGADLELKGFLSEVNNQDSNLSFQLLFGNTSSSDQGLLL